MKRHVFVHAVVFMLALAFCLGTSGLAWGQGKGYRGPLYSGDYPPGTRVTLLENNPAVGPDILMGMSGTVICTDRADGSGTILVSWDIYTGGRDDEGRCATPEVGLHVAGSAMWVDPADVKLGLPFGKVGTVQRDIEGCVYLMADDGTIYCIVEGKELGGARIIARSSYRARVRGLLNRTPVDPLSGRTCQQRDGDLYHPIVSMLDWNGPPCVDRWGCSFDGGDRVVLISESNPNGARDLPRGATGTIICPEYESGRILVSWDLWVYGDAGEEYLACNERVSALFPVGSTWWVSAKDLAKVVQTKCGTVQQMGLCVGDECLDPQALGLFAGALEVYYLAGLDVVPPDGQVKAVGLFTRYGKLLNGQVAVADTIIREDLTGMILNPVLLPCPKPTYCYPTYASGTRVELLVDEPGGAKGLMKGTAGTVVCGDPQDLITPLFVVWDDWSAGVNDDEGLCHPITTTKWWPPNAGWWMTCAEVRQLFLADLYDVPEAFHGLLPATLVAGKQGQRLRISGTVGNRGAKKTPWLTVEVYVSADQEITRDDRRIGSFGMQLDVGGRASLASNLEFPVDIPAGTYYVGWIIDVADTVREENENNNIGIIPTPLTVVEP